MEKDSINIHSENELKQTDSLTISETHLLIPMIWEGDLSIHSNVPEMKQSLFKDIILHGDTGFALAIQLLENALKGKLLYKGIITKYRAPLLLHDTVFVRYKRTKTELLFQLLNTSSVVIVDGELRSIEVRT